MKVIDVAPGSEEWRRARAGSLGASSLHEAIAKTKSGWSASRANVLARLAIERLTGKPQDTYQNSAMLHGIETEPEARMMYSFIHDVDVRQVGLVLHPTIDGTHCSPDGIVGETGLVELKCPQPAAHLAVLLGEPFPSKYVIQAQWQMRCCEREWCDLVSYSPVYPENMRLHVERVNRDDRHIAELESQVRDFLAELEDKLSQLRARYEIREAA